MSEASVPAQAESICDKLVALAGNEHHNAGSGDPVDHSYRFQQNDACPHPTLEWRGPLAFARAYGALSGIDHEFGTRWGSNGDQRVSLRLEFGADTGLLYAYDPTWDEYAILGADVPLAVAEDAFARALQFGEHAAVEDFVTLLPHVPADRRSPGPEL